MHRVRQEAAEALRTSEERFRALVVANSSVVYRMSPDWSEMLELRGREFIADTDGPNQSWLDKYIHPDDQPEVLQAISQAIRTKSTYELEHRVLRLDGSLGWTFSRAVPLLDESGRIVEWFGVAADITERKRAEERLREAQRLESIGVLAGGIAHDFNNLLVGVMGNASLAQDLAPENGELAGLLGSVVQASERAAHLTRQLLAYAGKGHFVMEPVNLSGLVRDMTGLLSIPKKVRLTLELDPDLPAIEADIGQIQQVVMNLVMNAAEALEGQSGSVSIRIVLLNLDEKRIERDFGDADLRAGEYVALEVRDSGRGMDEATRARIFDPFFTTKFTGRGLGLAAVAGIVRSHHGAIQVSSTPGMGSTFLVVFPAALKRPFEESPERTTPQRVPGMGTVLVVDDEDVVRSVAQTVLEKSGYGVCCARITVRLRWKF